jgi:hypothetical protein
MELMHGEEIKPDEQWILIQKDGFDPEENRI